MGRTWLGHGRTSGAATPLYRICAELVKCLEPFLIKFHLDNTIEIYENEYLECNSNEMFVEKFLQDFSFEVLEGKYVREKSIAQTLVDEYICYHLAAVLNPLWASEGAPPAQPPLPIWWPRGSASRPGGVCVCAGLERRSMTCLVACACPPL